ncbi:hypothetical protein BGZ52_000351, partial [Haplosporangium bisporale]
GLCRFSGRRCEEGRGRLHGPRHFPPHGQPCPVLQLDRHGGAHPAPEHDQLGPRLFWIARACGTVLDLGHRRQADHLEHPRYCQDSCQLAPL